MGWSSGTDLMIEIIKSAKKHVPDESARVKFYRPIIKAFENHDCDTLDECRDMDSAFDKVLGPTEDDE